MGGRGEREKAQSFSRKQKTLCVRYRLPAKTRCRIDEIHEPSVPVEKKIKTGEKRVWFFTAPLSSRRLTTQRDFRGQIRRYVRRKHILNIYRDDIYIYIYWNMCVTRAVRVYYYKRRLGTRERDGARHRETAN